MRSIFVLLAGLTPWAAPGSAAAEGFVRVETGRFVVDGVPLRFLGGNAAVVHGARDRAGLEAAFDAVAADGGRVVRVWALGEGPEDAPPWRRAYAFRLGPTGFVEASYAHLDAVLDAAHVRGLRVVFVLANRWKDYGGFPEYLRWCAPDVPRDDHDDVPTAMLDRVYRSACVTDAYRAHVARVVGRVHARTAVAYRDDPTIFGWELVNEASAESDDDVAAQLAWTREQATFVHALDPNHLVAAGHIGYDTLREREAWAAVQALDVIDYADAHLYPLSDPRLRTPHDLVAYVEDRVAIAHALGKPLVFGEWGFDGDAHARRGVTRATWFRVFLGHVERLGVAGALVWFYEPAERSTRRHALPATDAGRRHGLRTLLRGAASRLQRSRAPLAFAEGASPRFRARQRVAPGHTHRLRRAPEGFVLTADALAIAEISFERAGVHARGPSPHVFGVGEGAISYRFVAPNAAPPTRLVLSVVASSELEGRGLGAGADETSVVRVTLDGAFVGTFVAAVDDGVGRPVEVTVDDRDLLARLFRLRGRVHRIRFEAASRPGAGGLCLYGDTPGEAEVAARSSTLRLVWQAGP